MKRILASTIILVCFTITNQVFSQFSNTPVVIDRSLASGNTDYFDIADLDQDGEKDIVLYSTQSNSSDLFYFSNDGTGLNYSRVNIITTNPYSYIFNLQTFDYDNDGKIDLCAYINDYVLGYNYLMIYKNQGLGIFDPFFQISLDEWNMGSFNFVDINNDSYLDISFTTNENYSHDDTTSKIFINSITSFDNYNYSLYNKQTYSAWGDFNGDSIQDPVFYWVTNDTISFTYNIHVSFYENNFPTFSFIKEIIFDTSTYNPDGPMIKVLDYNQDGLSDLMVSYYDRWFLMLNKGSYNFTYIELEKTLAGNLNFYGDWDFQDYNADGKKDLLFRRVNCLFGSCIRYFSICENTFIDTINPVIDYYSFNLHNKLINMFNFSRCKWGDMNGDNKLDAIAGGTVDITENLFNIFMNETSVNVNNIETFSTVKIYPNPSKDFLTLLTISNLKSLQIFSFSGQLIKKIDNIHSTNYILDISKITAGVYYIKGLLNDGNSINQLFIKNE